MNKKGAEMTIGTIIIIILALVVLVILVYGFSTGWSNLWEKITAFGGGKANVQTVVQGCQIACTTSSQYDYCNKTSNVVFSTDKNSADFSKKGNYNCKALEPMGIGLTCSADFGVCVAVKP